MSRGHSRSALILVCLAGICLGSTAPLWAETNKAEPTKEEVLEAIERAKRFLVSTQRKDASKKSGSWIAPERENFPVGITCLALLALLNSGMTVADEPIAHGLAYLRNVDEPNTTYEASLMIMVLTAAKDGARDNARLISLVTKLEDWQIKADDNAGSWSYGQRGAVVNLGGDRSNSQFAVLALREAQHAGIHVNRRTWEMIREYWTSQQSADGGWSYSGRDGGRGGGRSTGSMTVAGISTLVITDTMLRTTKDENPDGTPICCKQIATDNSLERGIRWLENETHFSVRHNPGGGSWLLYYLYGLERAGRLSGRRFFGRHDWYREGIDFLLQMQNKRLGCWKGVGALEDNPVIGTSMALLFLSKGLSPVLINKLKYGPRDPGRPDKVTGDEWNVHPHDVQNLTEMISDLPDWPKLLTTQQVDIGLTLAHGGVQDLMQAPILFFNGADDPNFSPAEIELLKEYVAQGGFILAEAACSKTDFDRGFRSLIAKMYPQDEYKLRRLTAEHPVFRSEYLLDADTTELWGVDVGCRTSIMYSPHDLACLWDKWSVVDPPDRSAQLKAGIVKANRVGVNIVAYVTGREPPNKLDQQEVLALRDEHKIERGFLQIAKLRHTGSWDAAPHALRNLLLALNSHAGIAASTQQKNIPITDPGLFKFPLVYMHGRNAFQLKPDEQSHLLQYLQHGGVLFADSCCGAPQFDKSFRTLMEQMFPDHKFKRIPAKHELFTSAIGHDLSRVRRREPEAQNPKETLKSRVVEGEPYLEGIEIDGRYVVIYSKYDISCALERQASLVCTGYVAEDAVKIAVNVVLYALLQ